MIDSKTAGSRYATRVRIAVPAGSVFNGMVGTVVTQSRTSETVIVRLDRAPSTPLAFGPSELKEIAR